MARPLAFLVLALIERCEENYVESITNFENAAFYSQDKATLITINIEWAAAIKDSKQGIALAISKLHAAVYNLELFYGVTHPLTLLTRLHLADYAYLVTDYILYHSELSSIFSTFHLMLTQKKPLIFDAAVCFLETPVYMERCLDVIGLMRGCWTVKCENYRRLIELKKIVRNNSGSGLGTDGRYKIIEIYY